jgi:tRNA-dihydrouridine synthase A
MIIEPPTTSKHTPLSRKFCVAPMMDWTDRHQRHFARLLSKRALLYTEMVTTGALIYGDKERHLDFSDSEQPVALQLGGSAPAELATCSKLAENWGYQEVNLNVGCPSDRVQNNMIGACLMGHQALVKDCLSAMREACSLPVTIKHRIGIDDIDSEQFLIDFVGEVAKSGCSTFIVHARKAILKGLSPKENREIPPLIYDRVYKLKTIYPDLEIIINGGITSLEESLAHLKYVDGVMLGREAYHNPWLLTSVDEKLYGDEPFAHTRHDQIRAMYPYIEERLKLGDKLSFITRHMLGIFHAQAGGKRFRRYISENAFKTNVGLEVLEHALSLLPESTEQNSFAQPLKSA